MVESFIFQDGKLAAAGEKASVFVFTAPTEEERGRLQEEFGLARHEIASALDPDELGRVGIDGARASVILKRPRNYSASDNLLFLVASIGVFLTPKRVVVVASDPVDLGDERIVHGVQDPADLLLRLIYDTIAHFLAHLRIIHSLSEALEKRVNSSMNNRYLLDLFTLQKSLVYFVDGIGTNMDVIARLHADAAHGASGTAHGASGTARWKLGGAQRELLEEILIENRQCARQAEIYSSILRGLVEARGAVTSNSVNVHLKRLTVICVVFLPMTVLACMGGMSEFSRWTGGIPWWLSYPAFLVGLVPVGLLTYMILRSRGMDREERRLRKAARRNGENRGA